MQAAAKAFFEKIYTKKNRAFPHNSKKHEKSPQKPLTSVTFCDILLLPLRISVFLSDLREVRKTDRT